MSLSPDHWLEGDLDEKKIALINHTMHPYKDSKPFLPIITEALKIPFLPSVSPFSSPSLSLSPQQHCDPSESISTLSSLIQ